MFFMTVCLSGQRHFDVAQAASLFIPHIFSVIAAKVEKWD
jgi:hypothetical protein